ncbi:ATP-binding protein [Egicoccus halophilus]|uniref:histidine kinase n=1 Tax=Egicoccus halophilus TaxID=1670830 RepID=A0A8J3AIB9_9ACTN|nr:ATP-binding protein [Egicoccus halophilus]GGI09611.1 hypothetical protein GCM10011354_34940 [Egicoccus halophilus]
MHGPLRASPARPGILLRDPERSTLHPPRIPEDEAARLAALDALALVGTDAEERFDRITRTVGRLLGMPIAMVNLVTAEAQWAKSAVGMDQGATVERERSFCAHVVGDGRPVLVEEALDDPRFVDNPMVTTDPRLRAYFGMPVRGPGGHVLGSLCVADVAPRALEADQLSLLADLAGWVEAELDRTQLAAVTLQERRLRQRLEAITGAMGDGILVFDRAGRIEASNAAASRLLGRPSEVLHGAAVPDLLPPTGTSRAALEELLGAGRLRTPLRAEIEVARPDGAAVPLEVTVASANGTDTYVVVGRDVTDRRRHDAALQNLRQLYASILDAAADAIVGLDRDGRIQYANPAAHRLFVVPEGELLGEDLHTRFHHHRDDGSPYPWQECPSRQTLVTGRPCESLEERYHRADGTTFSAEYVSTPLVADGVVSGAVLMIRDVEERRTVERLKDEFVATVSHELRTPLTSIKGTLALVLGGVTGVLPADVRSLLEVTHSSTERLIRLVNDILDLERMVGGHLDLRREPSDARELTVAALDNVGGLADEAGVTIATAVEPVPVFVDVDRMVQVLTNLLGNAIKFSPTGGTVRVSCRTAPEGLVLTVADEGPGIALDAQQRIFERFGQADGSDRREKEGTGLGLPIARGLVEQHGGRLEVESEGGSGSRFHLTLPALPTGSEAADSEVHR